MRLILWALVLVCGATALPTKEDPASKRIDARPLYKAFNEKYYPLKNVVTDGILAALEDLKELMLNGDPANGVPVLDPFLKSFFRYDVDSPGTSLVVEMNDMTVSGGANFNNPFVDFNLIQLKLQLNFTWPELAVHADRYFLDGTLFNILPLYGEGAGDLRVTDLQINGLADLSGANDQVTMTEFNFDIDFATLEGNLEGFLGGGELGQEINDIINTLGDDIFDMIKGAIIEDVELIIMARFNEAVDGMSLQDLIDLLTGGETTDAPPLEVNQPIESNTKADANEYMDNLLANVREYMLANGMDNLALPDQIEGFSDDWLGITWHGEASLTEGYMTGLHTIFRSGDAILEVVEGGIRIASEIAFDDFEGGYKMHVDFMDIGLNAYASARIRGVRVWLDAYVYIGETTTVNIAALDIFDPGLITVDFDGLGLLDWIIETLGFLVINIFGSLILDAISVDLREALQEILENITSPPAFLLA